MQAVVPQKEETMMRPCFRKIRNAVLLALSMAMLAGCGLKGDPKPNYSRDAFAFSELSAVLESDGVVSISGKLTGAFQNAEYLVLQMQPVDGDLCAGCPFLPQDQFRIDASEIWEDGDGTTFSVVYSPLFRADLYRWRMVGYNTYAGIGAVASEVQSVGTESALIEQGVPVPPVE